MNLRLYPCSCLLEARPHSEMSILSLLRCFATVSDCVVHCSMNSKYCSLLFFKVDLPFCFLSLSFRFFLSLCSSFVRCSPSLNRVVFLLSLSLSLSLFASFSLFFSFVQCLGWSPSQLYSCILSQFFSLSLSSSLCSSFSFVFKLYFRFFLL